MKIILNPEYLDVAKEQAFILRSNLINRDIANDLELLHTKDSFLDTWAYCLGHKNWGELQSACDKQNGVNLIITPYSIDFLADRLCEKSYAYEDHVGEFEKALLLSTYKYELELFDQNDVVWHEENLNKKSFIVAFEPGPKAHEKHLVDLLFKRYDCLGKAKDMEKELLNYAKSKRKGLKNANKAEIEMMGLNIYPKSGVNVSDVIEDALKNKWIEEYTSFNWSEPTQMYKLAERSINWLFGIITSDYSADWLSWNKSVDTIFEKSSDGRRLENCFSRIKGFAANKTPEEFAKGFINNINPNSFLSSENGKHLNEVLTFLRKDLPEYNLKDIIFHVNPRLLLDYGELDVIKAQNLEVKTTISLSDSNGDLIGDIITLDSSRFKIGKPFPNKRHVVAIGKSGYQGEMIVIPEDTAFIECIYHWKDKVTNLFLSHILNFSLKKVKGNTIFSTNHIDLHHHPLNKGVSSPLSFFSINAVSGSASNVDELKTISRFVEQINSYERKDNAVKIEEQIELTACTINNYYHSL